jgi:REP element-mobilizing transposase RayT
MIDNQDFPAKCRSCLKADRDSIISNCQFCRDYLFPDTVLCDLNRTIQSSANEFDCHAFQPMLNLVTPKKKQIPDPVDNDKKQNGLFLSDETKYQIALYLQKLDRDPDFVYTALKYHISWNVSQREKAFPESPDSIEAISAIFKNPIKQADTIVLPLWIASDHVHVYVETSGKISIDKITRNIKKATEQKLIRCLNGMDRRNSKAPLWDDAYFVETIG